MQVVVGKSERAVESLPGQAARVPEAHRRLRRTLLGNVPDQGHELRLFRIGTRFDVGFYFREKAHRVEPLVVAFNRIGIQHHAGQFAQHAADHRILGARIAGNLDDRDARDVNVVLDVRRSGLEVDRRRIDAALEVPDLEMVLVLVQLGEDLVIRIPHRIGIHRSGLERKRRQEQRRREQRVAADDDVLDDQALLDRQRHGAGLRVEVDILDVGGNLSTVADPLVVVIDLQHVLAERVGVEDLPDRQVHQRQQGVAGNLLVPRERDLRNHRILDDAIRDRDPAGALADERRSDVGKIPERVDPRQIALHDLWIVRRPPAALERPP